MRLYFNSLISASSLAVLAGGLATGLCPSATGSPDENPDQITLTGVVRDFIERTEENGHPDFERQPDHGFGQYCKNISTQLGEDDKPIFQGNGRKLKRQYKDSDGNPICWSLYDSSLGDASGRWSSYDDGGIDSSASFDEWFNDVLGTNMSRTLDLELVRESDGSYVFDSEEVDWCQAVDGFFPIENQLFGNPEVQGSAPDRNFHFTFELHTSFTYQAEGAQVFTFRGDDDVWVFVDGQLVIDLGGVHGAIEQTVDINRLGLEDGETYQLSFFFAERHRTQSNFRIQTNLLLETAKIPTVTAAYD
jgi:fibro-slime domain-containing protein